MIWLSENVKWHVRVQRDEHAPGIAVVLVHRDNTRWPKYIGRFALVSEETMTNNANMARERGIPAYICARLNRMMRDYAEGL